MSNARYVSPLKQKIDAAWKQHGASNYREALALFEKLLKTPALTEHQKFDILLGLGKCEKSLGYFAEAIYHLTAALDIPVRLDKKNQANFHLAVLYLSLYQPEKAKPYFLALPENAPKISEYLKLKAELLCHAGKVEDALKILEAHPNDAYIMMQKAKIYKEHTEDFKAALTTYIKAEKMFAEEDPISKAWTMPKFRLLMILEKNQCAQNLSDEKDQHAAIEAIKKQTSELKSQYPHYPEMHLAYARVTEETKEPQLSNDAYEKMEAKFPEYWQSWHSHAVFLHKQGCFEESIPKLKKITQHKNSAYPPTQLQLADAHHALSIAYEGINDIEHMITEALLAIKFNPRHAAAHSTLGKAYSGSDAKKSHFYFEKSKELHLARWNRNHPGTTTSSKKLSATDQKENAYTTEHKPNYKTTLKCRAATAASVSVTPQTASANIDVKHYPKSTPHKSNFAPTTVPQLSLINPFDALAKDTRKADKKEYRTESPEVVATVSKSKKIKKEAPKPEKQKETTRPNRCSFAEVSALLYANATTAATRGYGFIAKRASKAYQALAIKAAPLLTQAQLNAAHYSNIAYLGIFGEQTTSPMKNKILHDLNQTESQKIKKPTKAKR